MNAITPFQFGELPVRIEDRDGALWFVLTDVCKVLEISNVADAASRLDDDERDDVGLADAIGREQSTTIINESGLYSLVLRSRKPAARRFKRWVTAEVLPTIRRTGGYGVPPAPDLDDNATLRTLLLGKLDQLDAITTINAELRDKADALDRLVATGGALAPTHAAKAMGVRPSDLFDWLEEHRWLYRGADGLVGYQDKIEAGYIVHKVHRLDRGRMQAKLINHALITPKGVARLTAKGAGR